MEISPRLSGSLEPRAGPSSSSQRAEKAVAGSGSSEDSMASELGRLSEENAHYRRKISELMGKSSAQPTHSRSSSGSLGGVVSTERVCPSRSQAIHCFAYIQENSKIEEDVNPALGLMTTLPYHQRASDWYHSKTRVSDAHVLL